MKRPLLTAVTYALTFVALAGSIPASAQNTAVDGVLDPRSGWFEFYDSRLAGNDDFFCEAYSKHCQWAHRLHS